MKRTLLALAFAFLTASPAAAQTLPIGTPPAPGRPTSDLVLQAMLATARAAAANAANAQAASLSTSAAIQHYRMGDVAGARSAAIQALIQANAPPPAPIRVLQSTIPQASYLQTQPFPIPGGSVGAVDANAFVAQARGAVAACASRNSANTPAASAQLAAAQRDLKAAQYQKVTAEARAAVNLCAGAQAQINAQP